MDTPPTAPATSATPTPTTPAASNGGRVALRGMQVQILIALFEVLRADPPFTRLTLEPSEGNDKFDYTWDDEAGQGFAVQVKTTQNQFAKAEVKKWAQAMRADHTARRCTLRLLGAVGGGLRENDDIAGVKLSLAPLDQQMLADAVAKNMADFTSLPTPLPVRVTEIFTDTCVGRLFDLAKTGTPITRAALRAFLLEAITLAPRDGRTIDISRLVEYTPPRLPGREAELAQLDAAWQASRNSTHRTNPAPIFAIVAQGGEGKTALICWWLKQLKERDWPGTRAVYAWSFYSQGTQEQQASSSDIFLYHALCFFGAQDWADSNRSSADKGSHLARLLVQRQALLVLDGLEPLQHPPGPNNTGALRDECVAALLRGLCGAGTGGALCVLTSRVGVPDFGAHVAGFALQALPDQAAVELLRRQCSIGSDQDFLDAVRDLHGHALSITILAHYVHRAHAGDIRKRALAPLREADAARGGHAARVLDAYCHWLAGDGGSKGARMLALLHVLGLFDRPASRACVQSLLRMAKPPKALAALFERRWRWWGWPGPRLALPDHIIEGEISDLHDVHLITKDPAHGEWQTLDAHPLLREYFAQRWREQDKAGFRAAHRCLFAFLQENTQEGKTPGLRDLLPLYQAVAHGCLAGEVQVAWKKVYWGRILRWNELYSIKKLGAHAQDLAAMACFFAVPWQQVVGGLSTADQAWLLCEAAVSLGALGRLKEAVQPMQAGLAMYVTQHAWQNAAIQVSNLADLQLLLGQIAAACNSAQQAVEYTDQSGDADGRKARLTDLAYAMYQSGQTAQAIALMQEASIPGYVLLFGVEIFLSSEILLESRSASAQQVADWARQTLAWAQQYSGLLEVAIAHLTLARCALLQGLRTALAEAEQAVAGLRKSGTSHHLPRALLTRAAAYCHNPQNQPSPSDATHPSYQAAILDLNESFDLCQRGPMPLFMADTLLTRVRLFAPLQPAHAYPWASAQADLQAARRIIDECGYERRRAELEELTTRFATTPSTMA